MFAVVSLLIILNLHELKYMPIKNSSRFDINPTHDGYKNYLFNAGAISICYKSSILKVSGFSLTRESVPDITNKPSPSSINAK